LKHSLEAVFAALLAAAGTKISAAEDSYSPAGNGVQGQRSQRLPAIPGEIDGRCRTGIVLGKITLG
jgi:hypothetical protein